MSELWLCLSGRSCNLDCSQSLVIHHTELPTPEMFSLISRCIHKVNFPVSISQRMSFPMQNRKQSREWWKHCSSWCTTDSATAHFLITYSLRDFHKRSKTGKLKTDLIFKQQIPPIILVSTAGQRGQSAKFYHLPG